MHKIYSEEEYLFQTLQGIWWIDYSGGKDCTKTSADLPHESRNRVSLGTGIPAKYPVTCTHQCIMTAHSEQTTNT